MSAAEAFHELVAHRAVDVGEVHDARGHLAAADPKQRAGRAGLQGDITHLHIGFKGTMNALFLKDLAEKTHRGLRGRVESGKAGGGLCYGYRVVRTLNAATVTTGEREIEPTEAAIVQRIFREFIAGHSPKQIAKMLNREGISGPFGGKWSPSTIHGNPKRGTGILNNELYIGRMVWNRLRYPQGCRRDQRRLRWAGAQGRDGRAAGPQGIAA